MTATPSNTSTKRPGKPPVVDLATWQAARPDATLVETIGRHGHHH